MHTRGIPSVQHQLCSPRSSAGCASWWAVGVQSVCPSSQERWLFCSGGQEGRWQCAPSRWCWMPPVPISCTAVVQHRAHQPYSPRSMSAVPPPFHTGGTPPCNTGGTFLFHTDCNPPLHTGCNQPSLPDITPPLHTSGISSIPHRYVAHGWYLPRWSAG